MAKLPDATTPSMIFTVFSFKNLKTEFLELRCFFAMFYSYFHTSTAIVMSLTSPVYEVYRAVLIR